MIPHRRDLTRRMIGNGENGGNDMQSLAGQLLLASPGLTGEEFARTVILMVQHGKDGAMGLVLNRPLEQTIDQVLEDLSDLPCEHEGRLHRGGPCDGPLMAVHTDPVHAGLPIGTGLFFSVDRDEIEGVLSQAGAQAKFFVGYAGWGPGQLESELQANAWVVLTGGIEQVFAPGDGQWHRLMRAARRAASLSHLDPKIIPTDPSMN